MYLQRSRAEQRRIEQILGVPPRLRGWKLPDIEYSSGVVKAGRLIAWATAVGGSRVTAFPLDRARLPVVTFDVGACQYRRLLPPNARPGKVIVMPLPVRRAA
nr:hypothetical protein [uncultured Rhodopila sp.]